MLNNDVLRSLRYMLDVSDAKMVEIVQLGGKTVSEEEITAVLKKDDEPGYQDCTDDLLALSLIHI
mgnify:FL=1